MTTANHFLAQVAPKSMLHFEALQHADPKADWVLLIHGAGGSIRTWKKQRDALSALYNLLIIDLPGHGESKHKHINRSSYDFDFLGNKIWEVVDYLKIVKIHLMGVSLGAIIAMQMRKLRPSNVVSMVLAGAIVRLDLKLKLVASFSLGLAKLIGFPRFYKFAALLALPKKNHKKSREIFIRESRHLTDEEFRKWTAMYGRQLNSTLKQIYHTISDIPTILIMGEQDHFFLAQAKKYVKVHKNAQLAIIEKCGHIVNLERADRFNELCIEFLSNIKEKIKALK